MVPYSSAAAVPAWTSEGDQWLGMVTSPTGGTTSTVGGGGGEDRVSVSSTQEFALMGVSAEEFVSEQARSSSVPADMYFGASNVHELSQQHHQQQQPMSHLSEHIETVLDEESFPPL